MKYFIFENGDLDLHKEEILLIKEFARLYEPMRNRIDGDTRGIQRKRAFREFTYMFLMYDWESPYINFSDRERHEAALSDSMLTDKFFKDEDFQLACKKYQEIQDTRMLKLLKSAYRACDELRLYFETVDLQERDMDGKFIVSAQSTMNTIAALGKTVKGLEDLESIVKKQREEGGAKLRGDVEPGMFD